MTEKLVVVGLDGATFRYLDPLMAKGKLPTLAAIPKKGVRGVLESVKPPISCPAWFCYSTGKNPGKLGIYGWRNFDPRTRTDRFNDYRQLRDAEMWDYLGQAGYRSAVINIPTMFPPKAVQGYMVSGMQAEEHQTYTHPPELKDEFKERLDYRVGPKHKMLWDYREAYEEILALFPKRFDAALHLLDKVDFVHTTIFHIDEIQHNAWNTPDLERAWTTIDAELKRFLDALPENTDVLFMSDHGFCERSTTLHINTWLAQEGYLHAHDNKLGEALLKVGVNRQALERLLRKSGLLNLAKQLVPENLQKAVKEADGSTSNQRRMGELDWDRTQAFASTNFSLHVFDETVLDEIIAKMRKITDPEGNRVFEEVIRATDVLHGDKMEEAPQVLYLPNDGFAVGDGIGKPLWTKNTPRYGGHHMEGIFMGYGPSFKEGAQVSGARLIDLAPTVLHAFGLAVPEDIDGEVLEVFKEEREVRRVKPTTALGEFSEQELEQVEDRLRGLGYIE